MPKKSKERYVNHPRNAVRVKWEDLVATVAALAACMYAFARVELRLSELQAHSDATDATRFTEDNWQRERAVLVAEIEKVQAELQVLCREVQANTLTLEQRTALSCPITYRAQNAPR